MKNCYAFNKKGEKVFCKTETAPTGILVVDYYLPRGKFSIIWDRTTFVKIGGIRDTQDGRKDIVRYFIHPSYWLGTTFEQPTYFTQQEAIDMVFNEFVNLYV